MKTVTSEIFDSPHPEFVPIDMDTYYPTRIDYFAARALQGLIAGRSLKNMDGYVKEAARLAHSLAEEIDKA